MTEKISNSFLRKHAPKNIGEQVHVNHESCPAGEDTKRRLYVKRVPGGVLGYCHHCSGHGFIRNLSPEGTDLSHWLRGKEIEIPDVSSTLGTPEQDKEIYGGPFSGPGFTWLSKYTTILDPEYIVPVRDPSQVKMKIYTLEHEHIIGYQIRNTVHKPKYITRYYTDVVRGDAAWFIADPEVKKVVITEDYLSAYKIFKICNMNTVALLKTSASETTIRQIRSFNPTKVTLWLDSDAAGEAGSDKLRDNILYHAPIGTYLSQLRGLPEPKECAPAFLKERLNA